MMRITEQAWQHLKERLDEQHPASGQALRVADADGGLELDLDEIQVGDEIVEDQGRPILVLDGRVAEVLEGRTLDVAIRRGRRRLVVK